MSTSIAERLIRIEQKLDYLLGQSLDHPCHAQDCSNTGTGNMGGHKYCAEHQDLYVGLLEMRQMLTPQLLNDSESKYNEISVSVQALATKLRV